MNTEELKKCKKCNGLKKCRKAKEKTKQKVEEDIKGKEEAIKAKEKAEEVVIKANVKAEENTAEAIKAKEKAEEDAKKANWKTQEDIKVTEKFQEVIKKAKEKADDVSEVYTTESLANEHVKVAGRYTLEPLIGRGSFGKVYRSLDTVTNTHVAIKVQTSEKCKRLKYSQLKVESKVLSYLKGGLTQGGFPKFHYYHAVGHTRFLVMDLLGSSLKEMFKLCSYQFSLKTVLLLMDQLLVRLQCLHSAGLIHRDLKPDNMLMGAGDTKGADVVHLIDFGLAKSIWSCYDKKTHIVHEKSANKLGTPRFMSTNAHKCLEQSRRDDMESLAFTILYFCTGGNLPWQDLDDRLQNKQMLKMKKETPPEQLFIGWPLEFAIYLKMVRKLEFKQEPDYLKYRKMFWTLAQVLDIEYDGRFDWKVLKLVEDKTNENDKQSSAHMI